LTHWEEGLQSIAPYATLPNMKKPRYSSNEFFIEHPDGSRTDAELHEPILAEGDVEAAVKVTRDRLKAKGWTEQQIDDWLGQGSGRAASKLTDLDDQQRRADLIRFYSIMETLKRKIGGFRKLADCSGKMAWPKRGVYFVYENDEYRSDTGTGPRIVRVGTHAVRFGSSSTLWQRLRQHKGLKSGGGNHRGSVFRLLLGEAIISKEKLKFPDWSIGNSAVKTVLQAELPLELRVSKIMVEMPFLWLPIDDDAGPKSLRSFVEQNSIGLLSNYERAALDSESQKWLGYHSPRERVKKSGLWNQDYVETGYAPTFLDAFERLVSVVA
jgi:hypothetical protein